MLWAQDSNEYKVVYVVCNEGDKETYNGVRYLSQADGMHYQPGWIPNRDESSDISIEIANPFGEIQEASVCRVSELALMSYMDTEGIGKDWEVRENYGWYSLTEYLVVSDDEILWICEDSYDGEKFVVEAFRYTDFMMRRQSVFQKNRSKTVWNIRTMRLSRKYIGKS